MRIIRWGDIWTQDATSNRRPNVNTELLPKWKYFHIRQHCAVTLQMDWNTISNILYFSSQITLRLNMFSFWDGAPCSLVDTDQSSPWWWRQ
jgi:hypothetical protein